MSLKIPPLIIRWAEFSSDKALDTRLIGNKKPTNQRFVGFCPLTLLFCSVGSAERQGFEPREPLSSTVFKTAAIDHSAIFPISKSCDLGGARTLDPMIKSHLLYQLSYQVNMLFVWVTWEGLEPSTQWLRVICSTSWATKSTCYLFEWPGRGSNPRPND